MFVTKDYMNQKEGFDWSRYFGHGDDSAILETIDYKSLFFTLRTYLKEDDTRMGFVMYKLLKEIFAENKIKSPKILEIGAATGFLTRSLLTMFGGEGKLVDQNTASRDRFNELKETDKKNISYILSDLFTLSTDERFDIVCSFGLVEHFVDKKDVTLVHANFLKTNGKVLIIAPLDTPLSRAYFELNPELNLGYRELMTKDELVNSVRDANLKIINIAYSYAYCYDFVAVLCEK